MKSKTSLTLSFLLFITLTNCQVQQNQKVMQNESLPKDIKLTDQLTKIIDTIFIVKNDVLTIESIYELEFKNKIFTSFTHKAFKDSVIQESLIVQFNENGNSIKTAQEIKSRKTEQLIERDNFENKISYKVINKNRPSTELEYKNQYNNGRLIKVETTDPKGNVYETQTYLYDSQDNLIKETSESSGNLSEIKSTFNKRNLLINKIQISNSKIQDSIVYIYQDTLLTTIEWYKFEFGEYNKNAVDFFTYDDKNNLIQLSGTSGTSISYKDYDASGNWRERESLLKGQYKRITKRSVFYE